jgi:hypothetical protein
MPRASSGIHQRGNAGPGDVRHPVDFIGDLRVRRFFTGVLVTARLRLNRNCSSFLMFG